MTTLTASEARANLYRVIDQAVKVGASFTRCQGGHMKLLGISQWYAFAYQTSSLFSQC